VHLTHPAQNTRIIENALGRRGLTCFNMRHNPDISGAL